MILEEKRHHLEHYFKKINHIFSEDYNANCELSICNFIEGTKPFIVFDYCKNKNSDSLGKYKTYEIGTDNNKKITLEVTKDAFKTYGLPVEDLQDWSKDIYQLISQIED